MTHEEAIELANIWVRDRFPLVPPVASAMELTIEKMAIAEKVLGKAYSVEERALIGHWVVIYKTDWDTDAIGIHPRLSLSINGITREVTPLFKDPIQRPPGFRR
jgi:hypothetical protein